MIHQNHTPAGCKDTADITPDRHWQCITFVCCPERAYLWPAEPQADGLAQGSGQEVSVVLLRRSLPMPWRRSFDNDDKRPPSLEDMQRLKNGYSTVACCSDCLTIRVIHAPVGLRGTSARRRPRHAPTRRSSTRATTPAPAPGVQARNPHGMEGSAARSMVHR